ncbi:Unannotated [Lentimonas sp. CC4]|nr:Unannotated [Lentimonas sp. CC4]
MRSGTNSKLEAILLGGERKFVVIALARICGVLAFRLLVARFDSDAGQPQAASPQLILGIDRRRAEACGDRACAYMRCAGFSFAGGSVHSDAGQPQAASPQLILGIAR